MRHICTVQSSLFDLFSDHEIGQELKSISAFIDDNPLCLHWVACDLHQKDVYATGRNGLTAEAVLRCALLKQIRQLSYKELAFYLCDSASFQAFARLPTAFYPKKSVLQHTISKILPETWERINHCVLDTAKSLKTEQARTVRIDSTVTESNVHEPTDSSLLWDSVRVMVRLLLTASELPGSPQFEFHNHRRVAKRRAHQIFNTRGMEKKVDLYVQLIEVAHKSLRYLSQAETAVEVSCTDALKSTAWQAELDHFRPLIQQVIDQTQRRVLQGEAVPAEEKILSLFEEHTDIIIKGSRDIQYGHKLNFVSGGSGLILDAVIESGNPSDTGQLLPLLKRHIEHHGQAPRQVSADGGYASLANLQAAKDLGVEDMAFNKKCGLQVSDMTKSKWVYRKLKNFRAGIEANISCLKRSYGLARCNWKGLKHFKSYVWSSVLAYNLTTMARLLKT